MSQQTSIRQCFPPSRLSPSCLAPPHDWDDKPEPKTPVITQLPTPDETPESTPEKNRETTPKKSRETSPSRQSRPATTTTPKKTTPRKKSAKQQPTRQQRTPAPSKNKSSEKPFKISKPRARKTSSLAGTSTKQDRGSYIGELTVSGRKS
ncbi:uncharacterized protein BKA78DRAFT_291977 [Phyllosticta capitalensis]|uniref:uncharacterized protein n=1 Tax=Phyllosticta capitalensis TaxID=121624 RepID=UPI00312E7767